MSHQSPRLQYIVALADRLAQRFAQRAADHDHHRIFPFENYIDLHEQGYLRFAVPEAYGGEGVNLLELLVAQEHLARGDGATALAVGMTLQLMRRVAATETWPQPVFAAICRDILEDGALINAAATEPEMGSPSRGGLPATRAVPIEDGWLVNGHKSFVTLAPMLRYVAVSVSLPPAEDMPQGAKASAIVRADAPGLHMKDTWSDGLSMRTSGSYDLFLEDVFVSDAWLVDRQPVGVSADPAAPPVEPVEMAWFVLCFSAVYLGIGQAACNTACHYAQERVPTALGKPIATLPPIQRRIGEMDVALSAARAYLHQTACMWIEQPEQRHTMSPRIAAAKYLCTNAALAATDQAMRVAGGVGLTRKLPLERYYRDARAGLAHPPNDDTALELIGRSLLDAARATVS